MSIGPRTHAPLRSPQHMLLCALATPPHATYHPTTRSPKRLTSHPAHPLHSCPTSCGTPHLPSHPPQPRLLHSLLATSHTSDLHTMPTGSIHKQHPLVTTHIDTVSSFFTTQDLFFYFFLSASWLFSLLLDGRPGIPSLVEPGAFVQDGGVIFFFFLFYGVGFTCDCGALDSWANL